MNALRISKVFALSMALFLTTAAFAANKKTVKLFEPATIGGAQLQPGEYSVSWDGDGSNVELRVMSDSKVVATAPAHSVELKPAPGSDGTTTKVNADGSRAISQIFFRGQTRAFEVGGDAAQAAVVNRKK